MFDFFMSVRFSLFKTCIIIILGAILIQMTAFAQADPPQEFKIEIADVASAEPGQPITVPILKTEGDKVIEGFDFLIKYDPNILTLIDVTPGELIADGIYEQFDWRFDPGVNDNSVVRVIGLRDVSDGSSNPNQQVSGHGELFKLNFSLKNNMAIDCDQTPIRFLWFDCGDNGIATEDADTSLFVISDRVFDYGELGEITDLSWNFPTHAGAADECSDPIKPNPPVRFIDFYNGSIQIDSFDDQKIKFEIEDFVAAELGQTVTATISKTSGSLEILGFDFLINYDPYAMSFLSADPGELYTNSNLKPLVSYLEEGWHNSTEEQTGLIRIIGLEDFPLSNDNPPITGNGELFKLNFVITGEPALECTTQPLRFIWHNCGDNVVVVDADNPVQSLISDRVIEYIDNSYQDITDPSMEFPSIYGARDECTFPSSPSPWIRFIDFQNGSVDINCLDDKQFNIKIGNFMTVFLGQDATIPILKTNGQLAMEGFDFLITYDTDILTFIEATPGDLIADGIYEHFEWRIYEPMDNIGSIRIVGVRDVNDGISNLNPKVTGLGELIKLNFRASSNVPNNWVRTPLRFFWQDCGDNGIAAEDAGVPLFLVSDRVTDYFGPEDFTDPSAEFPTHFGTPEECIDPLISNPPIRNINFVNGIIDVRSEHDMLNIGDVNLNGIKYEIADLVVFTNYLIQQPEPFTINEEGQIAATDIYRDGIPLTLNDYIYMIRVLEGAALPFYYEMAPSDISSGAVAFIETDSSFIIRLNCEVPVGGLFFKLYAPDLNSYEDITINKFSPAEQMDFGYDVVNDTLIILVYKFPDYAGHDILPSIENGFVDIGEIIYTGSKPELIHYEACGYLGEYIGFLHMPFPSSPPVFESYPAEISNNPDGTFYYDFNVFDSDGPASWINYKIIDGPGEIDASTGEYTLASKCGTLDPSFMVHISVSDGINDHSLDNPDMNAIVTFNKVYPVAIKGDVNGDKVIDLLDILSIIDYKYNDGEEPQVLDVADTNNDKVVNILDILIIINFKYKGGPAPACE
ncbi:MAG: hypothetical protein GY865_10280 [candidate division Zixibacteria bacterium]|nr:hypothetical protein [candidate division Zixibacteria bacterium]